jgi:hypothetical protein
VANFREEPVCREESGRWIKNKEEKGFVGEVLK